VRTMAVVILVAFLLVGSSFITAQAPPPPKVSAVAAPSTQWTIWQTAYCVSKRPGNIPGRKRDKTAKFSYALRKTSVLSQPYILVPQANNDSAVLFGGEEVIVEIYAESEVIQAVPFLSVDISSTSATALNPTPVRGTIGAASLSVTNLNAPNLSQAGYACSYGQLTGNTVPNVTVNVFKAGGVATDKPVLVMQTNLQQVHKLVYFNIATGIAASTIRDSTFSRVIATPAVAGTAATFKTVQQKGDPRIVPVLFFTSYLFHKIDPEVPFEKWDLVPQPSLGFSLTSPSSDFFFGGSSEFFVRNVQLVYGLHYGQTTHLVPNQISDPASKDPQATQKLFNKGGYVGLTFNIDFIKGLFSGGK
jgi:hypothetical protein